MDFIEIGMNDGSVTCYPMKKSVAKRKIKSVSVPRLNENYKYADWSIKIECANDYDYVLHFSSFIDANRARRYMQ